MPAPGATPRFRFQQLSETLRATSLHQNSMERYAPSGDPASAALVLLGTSATPSSVDTSCLYMRAGSTAIMRFSSQFQAPAGAFGTAYLELPWLGLFAPAAELVVGRWRATQASTGNECQGDVVPMVTGSGDTFSRVRFRYVALNPGAPTDVAASAPWAWDLGDTLSGFVIAMP